MREIDGTVARLGGRGDGVMDTAAGRLYVPFTVPGDRVTARIGKPRGDGFAAELRELQAPGPWRTEPGCPHFHACGGCALQHVAASPYAAWKRDQVVAALARRGLSAEVAPPWSPPPGDRRRAEFVARRVGRSVVLGFHERESQRIVDVETCLVLDPRLVALLAPLRAALPALLSPSETVDLSATVTETGVDLLVTALTLRDRVAWSALAERFDLARLAWRRRADAEPDLLALRRPPLLRFGSVAVTPPPGAFLQASPAAEAEMARLVSGHVAAARAVVDLHAGLGTFAARLAGEGKTVMAVDAAAMSLRALAAAAAGLKLKTETRDLARRPLSARELAGYDAALFDPPRAGAREQAAELAQTKLACIVAVSCEPSSFARDARLLVDGGFRLAAVQPIDQFPFTPHVELVAAFARDQ